MLYYNILQNVPFSAFSWLSLGTLCIKPLKTLTFSERVSRWEPLKISAHRDSQQNTSGGHRQNRPHRAYSALLVADRHSRQHVWRKPKPPGREKTSTSLPQSSGECCPRPYPRLRFSHPSTNPISEQSRLRQIKSKDGLNGRTRGSTGKSWKWGEQMYVMRESWEG